jgi:hypothetical protein
VDALTTNDHPFIRAQHKTEHGAKLRDMVHFDAAVAVTHFKIYFLHSFLLLSLIFYYV